MVYFPGALRGYPPQRGAGRNEVRPRGETSPLYLLFAGNGIFEGKAFGYCG
jgi:hypothetical protein